MTGRFLDNLTLSTLINPIPEDAFRRDYWDRQPLVIHRQKPGYYGDLLTLEDFDAAVFRAPSYVKTAIAAEGSGKSHDPLKASGIEGILADMRHGKTLILDHQHRHNPNLHRLCSRLAAELHHDFQTNLYLTPANGQGFSAHWDNHDVFVLQVHGHKKWKIETERRARPFLEENIPANERELRGELLEFTLEQGDLIYIPRGFVHAAGCGDVSSLHITLGVIPFTVRFLVEACVTALAKSGADLGEPLPLGFLNSDGQDLVQIAANALRSAADETVLTSAVRQVSDELVRRFRLNSEGQIASFFSHTELGLSDTVRVYRDVVYRRHDAEDSVTILVGTRKITFPALFRPALDHALGRASFAVRDIPGDLEDEERLAFSERLIEEGLAVRADC